MEITGNYLGNGLNYLVNSGEFPRWMEITLGMASNNLAWKWLEINKGMAGNYLANGLKLPCKRLEITKRVTVNYLGNG